ncbi:threonine/serine exporter family protein [Paenibacillus sp. E194]|uniref:threonine/serine exporter family protein n=1 Tax=Paenibacillus sp. E194 TaxID=1458845 RepID=UPI0009E4EB64
MIGTIGWITYIQLIPRGFGVFLSSFTSAFLLAFAARAAASKFRLPITVYVVPGLVPIVPGITFYEALGRLIAGSDSFSGSGIVQAAFGAAGIACGINSILLLRQS